MLLLIHSLHVIVFVELLPIIKKCFVESVLLANFGITVGFWLFELRLHKHVVWVGTIISIVEVLILVLCIVGVTSFLSEQFCFFGNLIFIGVKHGFLIASFSFGLILPHEVLASEHFFGLWILLSNLDLHIFKTHSCPFIIKEHFLIIFAGLIT